MYWADQGGFGVRPKIGKMNMDGSNPQVLINDDNKPESIAIDLDQKNIYYSTQYPSYVIKFYQEYFSYSKMFVLILRLALLIYRLK